MNSALRYITCVILAALAACAVKPRVAEPPILVDVGQGAYLRGPITVRDDAGHVVFDLPAGSVVKPYAGP